MFGHVDGRARTFVEVPIDPVLLAAWRRLTPMERKKLVQIALIISEK
jgi:hypothetical protein